MNSFKSKTMFYMLVFCALALPLIIGASYAIYTVEDTEQKSEEKVKLTTSNLEVDFVANEYISNQSGRLIKENEVTERADFSHFTVTNSKNSSNSINYTILISNIETTYDEATKSYPLMSEDFKWRLVRLDGEIESLITEGTFAGVVTDSIELTADSNLTLAPSESATFKLYIWLQESNEVQNHLLNKSFKSKITVNSVLL